MGYLSDVLAGGYTVFPLVGAYVPPIKGSVVMWWNMDQVNICRTTLGGRCCLEQSECYKSPSYMHSF